MQGSDLKMLREHRGLSRAEVAEALNLTEQFIEMMERGEKPVDARTEFAAVTKLAPMYVVVYSRALKKWAIDRGYLMLNRPDREHTIVGTYTTRAEAENSANILASGVYGAEVSVIDPRRQTAES